VDKRSGITVVLKLYKRAKLTEIERHQVRAWGGGGLPPLDTLPPELTSWDVFHSILFYACVGGGGEVGRVCVKEALHVKAHRGGPQTLRKRAANRSVCVCEHVSG
jgi:hypothetical protein